MFLSLADQDVAVGEEVRILVLASDPDGDRLRYGFSSDIPDAARITFGMLPIGAAELQFFTRAADIGVYYIDFTANDGIATTTDTVRLRIRSVVGKDSIPRFVRPLGPGVSLDPSREREISFTVEVVDLDSPRIKITQKPEVPGSVFEETDNKRGKEGVWRWRPSEAQLSQQGPQLVQFWADDGENPPIAMPYVVFVQGGGNR